MAISTVDLKITNNNERELVMRALISHALKCKETLKLHSDSKDALGTNEIINIAAQAKGVMESALRMLAKYFGVHLANSKFYCLSCAPNEGRARAHIRRVFCMDQMQHVRQRCLLFRCAKDLKCLPA